jgi:hypothetical protein
MISGAISMLLSKEDRVWTDQVIRQYLHCLEGPLMSYVIDRVEDYWINNRRISKEEFYNHPEVKRFLLLKALKDLK